MNCDKESYFDSPSAAEMSHREMSELSMSSSLDNDADMEVLKKMMHHQALIAQAMAGNQQRQTNQDVARLSCEKELLAARVIALEEQLSMSHSEYFPPGMMMQPSPRGMEMLYPHSIPPRHFSSSASIGGHQHQHGNHGFDQHFSVVPMMSPSVPLMPTQPYPGFISAPCFPIDDIDGRSISSVHSSFSSRSRFSQRSSLSRSSCRSASSKLQRERNGGFDPPLDEYVRPEHPPGSRFWKRFSWWMTCLVPDSCIPREGTTVKQAWREKVSICIMALALSAFVVGGIGFLPIYFCRSSTRYTAEELQHRDEAWTSLYGRIYIFDSTFRHPGGNDGTMKQLIQKDASKLFPRAPLTTLPKYCLDTEKSEYIAQSQQPKCDLTEEDVSEGAYCHDSIVGLQTSYAIFDPWLDGQVVIPRWELEEEMDMQYLLIKNKIYNVTQYINGLRDPHTYRIDKNPDHPNAYLAKSLHLAIVNKVNQDATQVFYDVFENDDFLFCLDELFFEAYLDDRYDPVCQSIGIFMYMFLFFVVGMLTIQVLCSLLYLAQKSRTFLEEHLQAAVMIMVPCYNEGETELRKTIRSCLNTTYPYENKILVIVCDGCVTGSDEKKSTPEICADLLGFNIDFDNDEQHHFLSLGKNRDNFASVYAGTYSETIDSKSGSENKRLKYVVIVKLGSPRERSSPRAGNRGKRDSQLVLAGMFNRIHHNRQPCELDMAMVKELFSLGLPAKDIEYLMTIDADTRVEEESINHMVYAMEHDKLILACCGETQVDNKSNSLVTAMQVFEYYSSHHLKKAFESVFGCVTCLPGCFTMYRVFTDDMKCLIASDGVYQDYSRNDVPSLHEKNLFELGEDRMLTTLLLQHFPGMRLSFVPEAICWTIVPHTFAILLSQRRRWINSTFHNMYELLKVENMCGICFLSMKTVVIMDMIVTMILPASLVYIGYLTYLFISQPETLDTFVLMFYGATFVMQMLSFLVRSRWDYIWWFAIFTVVGIPVFYFILPIYAFAHMDDFSWGKTRQIGTSTQMKLEAAIHDSEDDSTKFDDFGHTSTSESVKSSVRSNESEGAQIDETRLDGMDDVRCQSNIEESRAAVTKRSLLTPNEVLEEKHTTRVQSSENGSSCVSFDGFRANPVQNRDDSSVGSHRSRRSTRSQRSHRSSKSNQTSKREASTFVKYQALP